MTFIFCLLHAAASISFLHAIRLIAVKPAFDQFLLGLDGGGEVAVEISSRVQFIYAPFAPNKRVSVYLFVLPENVPFDHLQEVVIGFQNLSVVEAGQHQFLGLLLHVHPQFLHQDLAVLSAKRSFRLSGVGIPAEEDPHSPNDLQSPHQPVAGVPLRQHSEHDWFV